MHEAAYRALGLHYRYQPFAVEDVRGALVGMRALGIRGCGVSMPFKLEVLEHLDAVDPLARRIGAVNTVVNEGTRLVGYNTDAWGARRAFEEVRPLPGCRILLLGAGGAARAVAFAFAEAGAELTLANRDEPRAEALAAEVGARAAGGLALSAELEGFDAVVNASSRGMADVDPTSPIAPTGLRQDLIVMDIVYKPVATELVRLALAQGCRVVHGGRMLLHQATRQFELYTGCAAPVEVMDRQLSQIVGSLMVAERGR
jgi:shikimate dehydrogenase